ncbi:MAG: hypothetical protein IJT01_10875 [Selenomonadaceae bacterium]|nr:hypothetical protein [Selenomonadaceae bacterium]
MDADKTLRRADFSMETDFQKRLRQRLMEGRPSWEEGELADDFMEDVTAARAGPAPPPKKLHEME